MEATIMAAVNNVTNKTTVQLLPIASCFFLDFPNNNEDCVYSDDGTPSFCYHCRYLGKFVTGESLNDYYHAGHIIGLLILAIVTLLGILGTLANILIIAILKRRKSKRAFDTFLMTLACFDIICSAFPILLTAGIVIYFQNWNRGAVPLYMYYIGTFTALFGRSGSAYMTVVISFERFVVVAYSTRTRNWFNLQRTRILAGCSLLFSLIMAIPRYTSCYVGHNKFGKDIASTYGLEYVLMSTSLEYFFYVTLKGYFNTFDFWAPFPLLLLFNGLVYFHIFRYYSKQSVLDVKRRNDIRAVRMFLPVVIVLFLCNITPIVLNFYLLKGIYYRELGLGVALSYVVNSSVNLPIYYFGAASFRRETKEVLRESFPYLAKCFGIGGDGQGQANDNNANPNRH